jgi:hypothetical protein
MAIASSTGAQLQRAEVYSRDSTGKKIKRERHHMDVPCIGCGTPRRSCVGRCCDDCFHRHTLPAKETRSWAPRPVEMSTRETMEERTVREGKIARFHAELKGDERTVLELQGKLSRHELVRREITAGEASHFLTHGYTLVGRFTAERNGLTLECCVVEGYEEIQAAPLNYAEIAERIGKSVAMVNKIVSKVNAKLAALRF